MSAVPGGGPSWDGESREFTLTCDAGGTVRSLDARAAVKLKLRPGDSFLELAVPGTEEKLNGFFTRALRLPSARAEQSLVIDGHPATFSFFARPDEAGGVSLLGCWLPEGQSQSLRQMEHSVEVMRRCDRQIVRQQNEIETRSRRWNERSPSSRIPTKASPRSIRSWKTKPKCCIERRSSQRVIANVSHEFRTPLHTDPRAVAPAAGGHGWAALGRRAASSFNSSAAPRKS